MAAYPNLSEYFAENHEIEDIPDGSSDESADDAEVCDEMLHCFYDEYGRPLTIGIPSTEPTSVPEPQSEQQYNSGPLSEQHQQQQKEEPVIPIQPVQPAQPVMVADCRVPKLVTLHKDSSGKLGVRIRRMGNRFYFSFVSVGSPAARSGIGFGDQLLEFSGVHLPAMTGSSLMKWITQNRCTAFQVKVFPRPYDIDLLGIQTGNNELTFATKAGKTLGVERLDKICQKGYIKHLQLLAINGTKVLGKKSDEIMGVFLRASPPLKLRVMPRIFVRFLLKRVDKASIANKLQFSSFTD